MTVNIQGIDRAAVVAALYNRAAPQGLGFLHYNPTPMTVEEAQKMLDEWPDGRFDYLHGRVMKVTLAKDATEFEEWLYDRDNGQGAAAEVVAALRATADTNAPAIAGGHTESTTAAADHVRGNLDKPSGFEEKDGVPVFTLNYGDAADVLGPAVDKAVGKAEE